MGIEFENEKRIFTLQTDHTTYQFQADAYGFLLHLYYGKTVYGGMDYLLTYYDRGFPPIRMMRTRTEPIPWMRCHKNSRQAEPEISAVRLLP